jgi:hypothetical protein
LVSDLPAGDGKTDNPFFTVYWINHKPVLLPEFVYDESLVAPLVSCSLNCNHQQNKKIQFELSLKWRCVHIPAIFAKWPLGLRSPAILMYTFHSKHYHKNHDCRVSNRSIFLRRPKPWFLSFFKICLRIMM